MTLDGFLTRTNKRQDFDYFFLDMQLLEQAQTLLNFDGQTPFDVNILDAVINTMYRGQGDAVRPTNIFVSSNKLFFVSSQRLATTSERSVERFT